MTQETKLHVQYLGQARSRWEKIAAVAAISPELSGLTLDGPIILDQPGGFVAWTWNLDNSETTQIIFDYLNIMNYLTFRSFSAVSFHNINKTTEPIQNIFNKVYPNFAKRIKGTMLRNWQRKIQKIQ
jgi:hypothetical protein